MLTSAPSRECLGPWMRVVSQGVSMSDRGLIFGADTLLAGITKAAGLDADSDRLLTLLSIAYRRPVSAAVLHAIEKATEDWRRGDKALANLRLVFAGLPRLDDAADAERVRLASSLLDAGMPPRHLTKELGLDAVALSFVKYNPDQPRVPAGNGEDSGRWQEGGGLNAESHYGRAPDGTSIDATASADDPQGLKMAAAAARAAGLTTKDEKRAFHDEITGRGITSFQELLEIARSVKKPP